MLVADGYLWAICSSLIFTVSWAEIWTRDFQFPLMPTLITLVQHRNMSFWGAPQVFWDLFAFTLLLHDCACHDQMLNHRCSINIDGPCVRNARLLPWEMSVSTRDMQNSCWDCDWHQSAVHRKHSESVWCGLIDLHKYGKPSPFWQRLFLELIQGATGCACSPNMIKYQSTLKRLSA